MPTILETLRHHGPRGLPLADARQLFLWLYCVLDVLPEPARVHPPSRQQLMTIFSTLANEGVIAPAHFPDQPTNGTDPAEWDLLVRSYLLQKVQIDDAFFERAKEYLNDVA